MDIQDTQCLMSCPLGSDVGKESQVVTIRNMLMSLPAENYASLRYLIQFLVKVSRCAAAASVDHHRCVPFITIIWSSKAVVCTGCCSVSGVG